VIKEHHTIADYFNDPELFGSSALLLLVDHFGAEALDWEPETIEMELRVLGADPPKGVMDRLLAAITVATTDMFHMSLRAWSDCCRTLNFHAFDASRFDPPGLEDVLWGCSEARLLEGPETFDAEAFSPDIIAYVGELLKQSGIAKAPSVLGFAAAAAERPFDSLDEADEMVYKSYWDAHKDVSQGLEDFVIEQGSRLKLQLAKLPIKSGDMSALRAA
jgi:hypothetical protein